MTSRRSRVRVSMSRMQRKISQTCDVSGDAIIRAFWRVMPLVVAIGQMTTAKVILSITRCADYNKLTTTDDRHWRLSLIETSNAIAGISFMSRWVLLDEHYFPIPNTRAMANASACWSPSNDNSQSLAPCNLCLICCRLWTQHNQSSV